MSATQERTETREQRVTRLEQRLGPGFDRIGEATAKGLEVPHWEDKWIEILREYEQVCDEIAAHHAEPVMQVGMELVGVRTVREEVAS